MATPSRMREKMTAPQSRRFRRKSAYKSPMQVPRIENIVLNVGLGAAT